MLKRKTILVSPLYWSLGHAVGCVPIIKSLQEKEYNVLLAPNGSALKFLQKEFPDLEFIELPSYNFKYPRIGRFFKWKMLSLLPAIYKTINAEKKITQDLVDEWRIHATISDGRLGVRNAGIPSVYITLQLNILTGSTTYFNSRLHQRLIKKFNSCWVPDDSHNILNFSGKLGRLNNADFNVDYLGVLSRMERKELTISIDVLVLLSGPEPQRSMLEKKLIVELSKSDKNILLVQGIVEDDQLWDEKQNIRRVNFMQSKELEDTINRSEIVISRSGYTTIMDLATLEKKAFFIPTPGQYEQEYLAKRLQHLGIVPYCRQENRNRQMGRRF